MGGLTMKEGIYQLTVFPDVKWERTTSHNLPASRHTYYNNVFSLIIEVIPDKLLKLTEVRPLERLIKRCWRAK